MIKLAPLIDPTSCNIRGFFVCFALHFETGSHRLALNSLYEQGILEPLIIQLWDYRCALLSQI